jgi:hypothetical protein
MSDKFEKEQKAFVISQLRKASYKWKYRTDAIKKARIDRGVYKCASCYKLMGPKDFAVDHKDPVVDERGFVDWNTYVPRMICHTDNWQVICKPCHNIKTQQEKESRKIYRQKKKSKVKSINKEIPEDDIF